MAPTPSHNAQLVTRIAHSDDGALGELYDRLARNAYGLALRIVRDPELAEDVVQETFLTVWRQAARFDVTRGSVEAWLLTLTHRRAVDVVRREQRRRRPPVDAPVERPAAGADDDAEQRERRRGIQRVLGLLAPEQRQVLELAYYGGLTQTQIAAQLRQPLGTVKSRTHAALAAARALLTGGSQTAPGGPRPVATVGAAGVAFAAQPEA